MYTLLGYCYLCAETHGPVKSDKDEIERAWRREKFN